jgi:biotin transport system substrate-specific component
MLCTGALIAVPFGPVPFTLQTLMLFIIILVLRPGEALAAVAGYLALGALGFPVFAAMRGGLAVLAGPTGGFLLGYLVAAALAALVGMAHQRIEERDRSHGRTGKGRLRAMSLVADFLRALIAAVTYFTCGTIWFCFATGSDAAAAFAACVAPFVIPDLLKLAAAMLCAPAIRLALSRR